MGETNTGRRVTPGLFVAGGFLIAFCFWCLDAWLDARYFYPDRTFSELLLWRIPGPQLLVRGLLVLACLLGGGLAALALHASRETHRRLRESEARFRRLTENASDMIFRMALPDGRYEYVSPGAREQFGYEPEDFYRRPMLIREVIHPDWRAYFEEQWNRLLAGEAPATYEYQIIHHTGEARWLFQRNHVIRDEKGQPVAIEGIVTDLTRVKSAEIRLQQRLEEIQAQSEELQAQGEELRATNEDLRQINTQLTELSERLRANQEELRTITDNAPDIIARVRRSGRIDFANRALPGMESRGFGEADLYDWIPEDHHWLTRSALRAVFEESEPQEYEIRRFSPAGEPEWYTLRLAPVRHEGEVESAILIATEVSERKRFEEALQASETKYRTLYETMAQGVVYHAADGSIVDANPAAEEILGRSRSELLQLEGHDPSWQCVREDGAPFPPDEHPAAMALRTGRAVRETVMGVFNLREQRWRWIQVSAEPERGEPTRPGGVYATFSDITERKENLEVLRIERNRAQRYLDVAGVMILALDAEGSVTLLNQKGCEIVGCDAVGQVLGKNWIRTFVVPQLQEEMQAAFEGLLTGVLDPTGYFESTIRTFRGEERRIAWRVSLLRDGQDAPAGLLASGEDVTDRRKAERALRESERRFRHLVEQAADAFFLFDASGRILDVNRSATEQIGCDRALLLQKTLADLMPEETDASLGALWESFVPGEPVTLERALRREDGSLFPAELRLGRIDLQGEDLALALSRDLTERRELEMRVRQTEKMEAIGQLAGGIAHDFNNQLAGIMGCADLLRARVQEEDLRRLAELIVTSSERASDLTAKLLAFARRGKYRVMPVDIHQVIEETASLLEHSIDKRIRIRREFAAERSTTMGDPTQLQNALLNVALNARDAMPEGGVLTFRTELATLTADDGAGQPYEIEPGPHVRLVVEDTGCGMDATMLRRVFEPFYTTKPEGQGTGMGLPAVYGTIKNHKGLVEIRSEPGRGTEVVISLPLAEREAEAASEETSAEPAPAGGPPARILVVDDEEIVREMASEMLQSLGYEVVTSAGSREALALYRDAWQSFDLVILDMVMPEMGGRELFIEMRALNPAIRAVLATGYSLDGRSQAILREGVRAFIQKPFRSVELGRRVGEVLAARAPGSE